MYGSEIFPTAVRARGLNLSASAGAVGSMIVAQVWPVGIARIGSRIYFFFMLVNMACIPAIALLYPETRGRALEDMDDLFGRLPTRDEGEFLLHGPEEYADDPVPGPDGGRYRDEPVQR